MNKKINSKLYLEYDRQFYPFGGFDPEKDEVTNEQLKICLKEGKSVYEMGYLPGPDPAFIKHTLEDGTVEIGWA